MSDSGEWKIEYEDEAHEQEIREQYTSDSRLEKLWPSFERDVTTNPYHHHKHKRIVKMKDSSFQKGTYRYKKEPMRVVYYPEGKEKVIYPLEVAKAEDISYKKRSSK